jgi:PAS domain S-box-containing protein
MRTANRVLIVEDDFLVGERLRGVLEDEGYSVIGDTASGKEAIEMTMELKPDVVMMDIKLLEMDGLAAARRITAQCPTPIVALTAHENSDLVAEASESGIGYYLVKPAKRRELTRAIQIATARFDDLMKLRRLNVTLEEEIAERKRAEEALRESEKRFRMTIQLSPIGVGIVDSEGELTDCNAALAEMVGYTREDLLHLNFADFTHPDDLERERRLIEELWDERTNEYRMEKRYIHKDGHTVWVDVAASLFKDEAEKLAFGFAFVEDITERKRAEEKIEQYAAELERSNEELEQFAYVISHDLREPARMVKSYMDLLAERYQGQLDEKADMFIDHAVDGAERMQEMISALLDLSRVGRRGKKPTPVDVEVVLERTLRSLGRAIEEANAEVTHDPLPTVMADEAQLAQVFQNLIANAIKFHRDDVPPQVHISAERKGDEWVFSVADSGIGIDPEQADRIFQIFQRLHTEEEYEGTGIGLALCKRIVERHGGRIWVGSEVGVGSTFTFTLPAKKP